MILHDKAHVRTSRYLRHTWLQALKEAAAIINCDML